MEKKGIENLKLAVAWGISLGSQIDKSLEDKKFRWFEAFGFVDELQALAELLPHIEDMAEEFRDLDTEEKNELVAFVSQEFNVAGEWAERITQVSLDTAVSTYISVKTWKEFRQYRKQLKA